MAPKRSSGGRTTRTPRPGSASTALASPTTVGSSGPSATSAATKRTGSRSPASGAATPPAVSSRQLPEAPNHGRLMTAKTTLDKATSAQNTAQGDFDRKQAALNSAQLDYNKAKTALEESNENVEVAQKAVDDELNTMANDTLDIVDPPTDVVQGGQATFRAVISRYRLDRKLVSLYWETAGFPIVKGQGTDEVTVDTSLAGPGDYDIRVSLKLVSAAAKP